MNTTKNPFNKNHNRNDYTKATPNANRMNKFNSNEPGGQNDPMRKGLTNSHLCSYMKLLFEGNSSVDARRMVEDLRKPPRNNSSDVTIRWNRQSCPKLHASSIRVAVGFENLPRDILSAEELVVLEKAIADQIIEGWREKIQFASIYHRPGYLLFDCATKETVDWLRSVIPTLQHQWQGRRLKVITKPGDMPMPYNMVLFLPKCKESELKSAYKLIEAQNEHIDTGLWHILCQREEKNGLSLYIAIDTKTAWYIKQNNYYIYYRLSRVPVYSIKREMEAKDSGIHLVPATADANDQCDVILEGLDLLRLPYQ